MIAILCYLVTRAEAVASTSNTVKYQTIISCTTKLTVAVCNDLVRLSGCLLEKGLIHKKTLVGSGIETLKKLTEQLILSIWFSKK